MKTQAECPLCRATELEVVRRFRLIDTYKELEGVLRRTNNYYRNYILFEKILRRQVEALDVEFRLCRWCGFIFFSPRPDEADLSIKYEMIVEKGDTIAREEARRLVDLRSLRAENIRRRLEPYWRKSSGRALDVGGADGHCLAGFVSDFDCGILDFETRELWPGVKKWGNSVEDLQPDDVFDVIITCHTLEHVPDTVSLMAKVTGHLEEGGILYVEVPYGCAGEVHQTKNLITHINFFSEGSVGFLLEKAGLHVEYMASCPVLSRKRYLPVVVAIARRDGSHTVQGDYLKNAYSITRRQMSRSISGAVTMANVRLVLSRPVQYAAAFLAQALKKRRKAT